MDFQTITILIILALITAAFSAFVAWTVCRYFEEKISNRAAQMNVDALTLLHKGMEITRDAIFGQEKRIINLEKLCKAPTKKKSKN